MWPILFSFETPGGLQWLLPPVTRVYSYGFMLSLGAILASWSVLRQVARLGRDCHTAIELIVVTGAGIFIGGKLFYFLERPQIYFNSPEYITRNIGSGFVFYGSFIGAILLVLLYARARKLSALITLDLLAMAAVWLHGCGKIGCLLGGCCYGQVSTTSFGIVFVNPGSSARPLHAPLLPVQLYDFAIIVVVGCCVRILARREHFNGQLILTYALLYSLGRFVTEYYRGDSGRGSLFGGVLSYAQVVALLIIPLSVWLICRSLVRAKFDSANGAHNVP